MNNVGSKGFIGGTGNTTNPYAGGGAQNNARALGSIGRALSQVGEVGLKIAGELQQAKLSKEEDSALNQLEISRGQMEADVMEIKDPEERIKRTDDALSKMKVEMFSRDFMPPVLKERLESTWGKFHARTKSRALIQSAQLGIEQAAGESELIRYRHIQDMDLEGYNSHIDQKVEMGVYSPADGDMLKLKGKKEINSRKAEIMMESNPSLLLESLERNEFGFDEYENTQQKKKTDRRIKALRADELRSLSREVFANDIISEDKVLEMVASRAHLTEEDATIFLKNWKSDQPLDADEKGDLLDGLNSLHEAYKNGEMNLDEYQARHADAAAKVYREGNRPGTGALRSRAHHLDPAGWSGKTANLPEKEKKNMDVELIGKAIWDSGGFGKPSNLEKDASQNSRIDHAKASKEAKANREIAEAQTQDWVNRPENNEATWEDIQQKMQEFAAESATQTILDSIDNPYGIPSNSLDDELIEIIGAGAGSSILPNISE